MHAIQFATHLQAYETGEVVGQACPCGNQAPVTAKVGCDVTASTSLSTASVMTSWQLRRLRLPWQRFRREMEDVSRPETP